MGCRNSAYSHLEPVIQSFLLLSTLLLPVLALAQQTYNNDSIVKLVKAGLSDDLIISTIGGQPGHYDTTPDGIPNCSQDCME